MATLLELSLLRASLLLSPVLRPASPNSALVGELRLLLKDSLNQSEASNQVTWSVITNQRADLLDRKRCVFKILLGSSGPGLLPQLFVSLLDCHDHCNNDNDNDNDNDHCNITLSILTKCQGLARTDHSYQFWQVRGKTRHERDTFPGGLRRPMRHSDNKTKQWAFLDV